MLYPLVLENGKDGEIEILAQMGFSSKDSEYQLTASDKRDSEKSGTTEIIPKEKTGCRYAWHKIKIKKGDEIELELTEFVKDEKIFRVKKRISI